MKRYRLLLLLIGSVLLLNGCRKDDDDAVTLYALLSEQPGGDSKIYIDDLYACWENDDQIKINDTPYPVVVTNDAEALGGRKAAIYTVTTASTFTAAYPSEYVTNCNGGAVTLEIPSAQTYNNNAIGGKQNIVAPCVGYSGDLDFHDDHTAEEPLIMRNVGGLLHVTVENNLSQTLTLYAIEVESSVAYIAGTGDVDASSSEPSMTLREHKSKSITLHCNASNISLEPSESKDFYMVVAPFSEATKFTVHVLATGNDDSKKYTFHRESNSNITIGRNQLGNITTKLDADHTTGTERLFWGQGTESCPYMITCYADLDLLRKVVNYDAPYNTIDYQETYNRNSVHYIQTADIDIKTGSGVDTNNWGWYSSPSNYRPIGYSSTYYFQANYNGMYHKVSGLSLNCGAKTPSGDIGLFGVIGGGAKIHKLAVSGWIQNTKTDIHIGGIVGHAYLNCSIEECTNETNIYTNALSTDLNRNSYGIGGICGAFTNVGTRVIKNCVNRGHIYTVETCSKSYTNVNMGGILGYNACDGITVQGCSNYGAIESLNAISKYGTCGGICGMTVRSMTIANCENNGRVTNYYNSSTAIYNGGILARVDHTGAEVEINSCTNNGIVNVPSGTNAKTGGIVGGSTNNYSLTINLCTNTGAVTGKANTGGMIGYAYTSGKLNVNSCNNNGVITGASGTGGLIGYTAIETKISNCTNQNAISGTSSVGGIVGSDISTTTLDIRDCKNHSSITGSSYYVGGMIGYINAGSINMIHCYNEGAITGTYSIGGMIGQSKSGQINKCLNRGKLTATSNSSSWANIGGIVGYLNGDIRMNSCGNEGDIECTATTSYYGIGGLGGDVRVALTSIYNCYCNANIHSAATNNNLAPAGLFYAYNLQFGSTDSPISNCFFNGVITDGNNTLPTKYATLTKQYASAKATYQSCCYSPSTYAINTTAVTATNVTIHAMATFNPTNGNYYGKGTHCDNAYWEEGANLLTALNSWRNSQTDPSAYLEWIDPNGDGIPSLNFQF